FHRTHGGHRPLRDRDGVYHEQEDEQPRGEPIHEGRSFQSHRIKSSCRGTRARRDRTVSSQPYCECHRASESPAGTREHPERTELLGRSTPRPPTVANERGVYATWASGSTRL